MGQNNRQRRAAKQRQRAEHRARHPRAQFGSDDAYHDAQGAAAAAALLEQVLRHLMRGQPGFELPDFRRCAQRDQQAAVDGRFTSAVDRVVEAGWTPVDLYEVVRRKAAGSAVTHLLDVVAAATARHPAALVHPQWQAQLDGLGAVVRQTGGVSPSFDWAERSGQDWPSALGQLLATLALICALPNVAPVLPTPGRRADPVAAADGIDGRVLRRIRGLLAKAESSEHAEEAEALTAKAQELMTRYSIERAVAESSQPTAQSPATRRLWPESPYVRAKTLLIVAVADANNCRAIQSSAWDFVTIVGHAADLNVVELLTTSLLVQATRAMTQSGAQPIRAGTSRIRSFRQSFWSPMPSGSANACGSRPKPPRRRTTLDTAGNLFPFWPRAVRPSRTRWRPCSRHSSNGASPCPTSTVGTPDVPPPIARGSTYTTRSPPAPAEQRGADRQVVGPHGWGPVLPLAEQHQDLH